MYFPCVGKEADILNVEGAGVLSRLFALYCIPVPEMTSHIFGCLLQCCNSAVYGMLIRL
jgi:hypothetical protein